MMESSYIESFYIVTEGSILFMYAKVVACDELSAIKFYLHHYQNNIVKDTIEVVKYKDYYLVKGEINGNK